VKHRAVCVYMFTWSTHRKVQIPLANASFHRLQSPGRASHLCCCASYRGGHDSHPPKRKRSCAAGRGPRRPRRGARGRPREYWRLRYAVHVLGRDAGGSRGAALHEDDCRRGSKPRRDRAPSNVGGTSLPDGAKSTAPLASNGESFGVSSRAVKDGSKKWPGAARIV